MRFMSSPKHPIVTACALSFTGGRDLPRKYTHGHEIPGLQLQGDLTAMYHGLTSSHPVRMRWGMSKDAPGRLRRRFRIGLAVAAVGLIALTLLGVGVLRGGGGDAEPTATAPAPSTPGLTTEEQAHILQSEAELDDLRNLLLDTKYATADQGVLLRLDTAQQLLGEAIHERDLADQAREAAAYKQGAHSVAESNGSGGGAAPTAEVLSAIAAIGTAIAGLITALTALRRAKLSAGLT
jgi:hypothetical protein